MNATAEQTNPVTNKTSVTGKRTIRCADCRKKFKDWHKLQRHKSKFCPKSSLQFLCSECKAFFPSKVKLKRHISDAHRGHLGSKVRKSRNACRKNSCLNKSKVSSTPGSESEVIGTTADSEHRDSLKRKKMPKHRRKSVHLQKCKRAKAVTIVGQFRKRPLDVANANHLETRAVGSNPFIFTTSCAPDAEQFQFICQSCIKVRFAAYPELRQHEEWCARVRNSEGFVCLLCGRHFRNLGTLRRHTLTYHSVPVSPSEMILENPFQFSTTVAMDSASYPHLCQSCQLVCFNSLVDLRRHEDWCGQANSASDGSRCDKCGRQFRTADLLLRHTTASDCTVTDNTTGATDVEKCNAGTAFKSSVCDVNQESVARTMTYSVCPLCDVPFMSQYEQQVHFINIHNLTNSELKITRPAPKRPRYGRVGDEVTCLDCDQTFSSRLLLSRHKQICMKEKKYTELLIPVTDSHSRQSTKKKCSFVEDSNTSRKGDANQETTNSDFSAGTANKCKIRNNVPVTKLSVGGTSRAKKLQVSPRLLVNTAKVRNLIRCSDGKKLLVKSDGNLVLVGSGGRKVSTISGKTTVTDQPDGSDKIGSSSDESSSK